MSDFPGQRTDLKCPDCGAVMALRESRHGHFYGCSAYPACTGSHGAHPDGSPLGIPADAETKALRVRAHELFDRLWKGECPVMSRDNAYRHLRQITGLGEDEAHIGMFDAHQCRALIARLEEDADEAARIAAEQVAAEGEPSGGRRARRLSRRDRYSHRRPRRV